MSQTGSFSPNLHEGSRSEYLAQFIFSAFGTSVPVPHQEDTGLDLHCTLAERVGQRAWPTHYYAVQVKSTPDPWLFESAESVRWLVQCPSPLFFCVVDKSSARLRVYQTSPRFKVWSEGVQRTSLTVVPGDGTRGSPPKWSDQGEVSLGAPVLDFTVADALSEPFREVAWQVLAGWCEVDRHNLHMVRCHAREFTVPSSYVTNHPPDRSSRTTQGRAKVDPADLELALGRLKKQLSYTARHLVRNGRLPEAARAIMFLRTLQPGTGFFMDVGWAYEVLVEINKLLGIPLSGESMYQGIDHLNSLVSAAMAGPLPPTAAN